ncbi:hypothetical protein Tco_1409256 [Tanacetum coccineum]
MTLILAPKSARAFFTVKGLIIHGIPGSPSFCGKLLWMTADHSSLSLTDEAAFSSFSLCERRSFRTLAPLGMWIIDSRKDDLEGWYKVGDYEIPSSEFVGVSSPSGLSSSVVMWVADGAGADG